jgi:hypothetical protein
VLEKGLRKWFEEEGENWSDAQPSSTMSHTHGIAPTSLEAYGLCRRKCLERQPPSQPCDSRLPQIDVVNRIWR